MVEYTLECRALCRHFIQGNSRVEALSGIDLQLRKGERIALMGASGSGKTTLIQLLGGLDAPSQGEVLIGGQPISRLTDAARCRIRNRFIGFVYQFHHLLAEFTALENVAMPLLIRGVAVRKAQQQASDMLERVGLGERLTHKPSALSGGERQRAAIARALVTEPSCVLADEPTGNLDRQTADRIFELMLELNQSQSTSLIVATHDPAISRTADRRFQMQQGKISEVI